MMDPGGSKNFLSFYYLYFSKSNVEAMDLLGFLPFWAKIGCINSRAVPLYE